jgi:hypothetical protein
VIGQPVLRSPLALRFQELQVNACDRLVVPNRTRVGSFAEALDCAYSWHDKAAMGWKKSLGTVNVGLSPEISVNGSGHGKNSPARGSYPKELQTRGPLTRFG